MAANRFEEITDKQISEIKLNSVPKNTNNLCKNTKRIIRLRQELFASGDYRGIFPDNHLAFGE
jgi:hypothetical protein